jgi:GNAT superfamily N-acetyltransferase
MPESCRVAVASHSARAIPAEGVLALFRAEGWWPERSVEQISAVLGAAPAAGAWHGDELVGFARAVTDHVLRCYVEDVIVSPGLRGTGIGRALLDCLLEQLRPIPVVTLFCSPRLVSYYESIGFHATRQVVLHRSLSPVYQLVVCVIGGRWVRSHE